LLLKPGQPAKQAVATPKYADPAAINSELTTDIVFIIVATYEEPVTNTFFGSALQVEIMYQFILMSPLSPPHE
jgi:hypothetical protein